LPAKLILEIDIRQFLLGAVLTMKYASNVCDLLATPDDFIHRDDYRLWNTSENLSRIVMRPDEESRSGELANFIRSSLRI
jgi:hypothetical protein